jgi:hypothetical protein
LNEGWVQHYIIIKIIPTAKQNNLHYVNFTAKAYNSLSAGEKYIFFMWTGLGEPICNGKREWRTASLPRRMQEV